MSAEAGTRLRDNGAGGPDGRSGGECVGALGTMACMTARRNTLGAEPRYRIVPARQQVLSTGATGFVG
jgi:hypothetical protein